MENKEIINTVEDTVKKAGNKPLVVVLVLIVLIICALMVFTLSKAVDDKLAEMETTTDTVITEELTSEEETIPPTNTDVGTIKKYSDSIKNISVTKEAARIAVNVEFKDEESLLEEHYAANTFSVDVAPVFCFYLKDGAQIKLPGELRLLSDGKSVVYYLTDIDDLKNVAAQTDEITITLDNVMTTDFNIYIQHKSRDGVGKTILGTNGKSVEDFTAAYLKNPPVTENVAKDIKNIQVTSSENYIWFDIYFMDEEAYNKYNDIMCFGFEYGGNLYKDNFIVTEWSSLNMLRLKYDDYAMAELLKEMNVEELTVKQLFTDYNIELWVTDYKNEKPLFCLNGVVEVREKLNNSTAGTN